MKPPIHAGATFAVLAVVATGCATTRVSIIGSAHPKRTLAERIMLVQSDESLPEYEAVATIEVPNNAYRSANDAVREMTSEAAEIGADALLDVTWGGQSGQYVFTPTGSGVANVSGTRIVGTAIRWQDKGQAIEALKGRGVPRLQPERRLTSRCSGPAARGGQALPC